MEKASNIAYKPTNETIVSACLFIISLVYHGNLYGLCFKSYLLAMVLLENLFWPGVSGMKYRDEENVTFFALDNIAFVINAYRYYCRFERNFVLP